MAFMSIARHGLPALLLVVSAASAQPVPDGVARLTSCVSEAHLELQAADERVLLDAPDRAALGSAMLQRYPMLGRDGFAPAAILMWRKPGRDWLYVALSKSERAPGGWCFTASFAAKVFDVTPALERKYFSAASRI